MDETLLKEILIMLQEQSKEQAVLVNTVENIDKNVENLNKTVNGGPGNTGVMVDVALLKDKVVKLENLQQRMEDLEHQEETHRRNRFMTVIGIVVTFCLGLASIILAA